MSSQRHHRHQLARADLVARSSWWHNLLRFNLLFNDYHPFEVFRGAAVSDKSGSKSTYRLECPSVVTVEFRRRHLFARLLKAFLLYFLIKSSLLTYLSRTILYYKHNLDQWELLDRDLVYRLSKLIGHPFEPLGDASLLVYSYNVILATVLAVLMPHYYEHYKLMDMPNLRFLLRPRLERARVDLLIRQKILDLSMSIEHMFRDYHQLSTKSTQHSTPTATPLSFGHGHRRRTLGRFEHNDNTNPWRGQALIQLKLKTRLSEQTGRFRPQNYSTQWFQQSGSCYSKITLLVHATFGFWYLGCLSILYRYFDCHYKQNGATGGATNHNSTTNHIQTSEFVCDSYKFGSPAENWVTAEALLVIVICYQLLAFNVCLLSLTVINYLKSIGSIREQLVTCRRQLEAMNSALSSWYHHNRLEVDLVAGEEHDDDDELTTRCQERGTKLAPHQEGSRIHHAKQEVMLDALIRSLVLEHEIATMAGCLSELVAHFIVPILMQIVFSYMTSGIVSYKAALVRKVSTVIAWLMANMVGLTCAHISSQLLKLQSDYWSVLAENARHELLHLKLCERAQLGRKWAQQRGRGRWCWQHQEPKRPVRLLCPITRMWQKFVLATNMNLASYSARPFHVTINYGQLIELDFLGLFLYSLVKKF